MGMLRFKPSSDLDENMTLGLINKIGRDLN